MLQMAIMKLDAGQWIILKDAYDRYLDDILPFSRGILNAYFKNHTIDDRVVETTEELDVLISLCEIFKQKKTSHGLCEDEDTEQTVEIQASLENDDEQYKKLILLLNLMTGQREQYRLAQIRGRSNSRFFRRV